MTYKTETKEIEITSPIDKLVIGEEFLYNGRYKNGYEEGISKIKRFYYEQFYLNDIPQLPKKDGNENSVWMELENGKEFLLGFLDYKNKFTVTDRFNS